jgi:hypothetical protein
MDKNTQALTTPEDAPSSGDTTPVEQPGVDVSAAPSAESPGVTENSPTPPGDKPATLEDAISAALAEEKEPEPQPEAPPAKEKADSEKTDDEPEGKQDEPAQVEKKDDLNLDALSKKAQTRFRELSKENQTLRTQFDELTHYTGGEQGFDNFKTLLKLHAEDPVQAVPLLEKVLEDAKQRAGLVIQSDDIKRKLDDGVVDEATARELEQSRKDRERTQQKLKAEAESRQKLESERLLNSQTAAMNAWESNIRGRDPEYDNIADLVKDRFQALATAEYPETPADAVAMVDKAYKEVTQRLRKLAPAKQPMKVAASSGSSAKVSAKPKSIEDVIDRLLS